MNVYLLVASLACASARHILISPDEQAWRDWKVRFGKFYETEEEESVRKIIWTENVKKVNLHNLDVTKTHRMGVNHLSDLTEDEYKKYASCLKIPRHLLANGSKLHDPQTPLFIKPENVRIPDSVDWRSQGYVTPVKNQGQCGSCWAFSSTGSLEGQHFRKTGSLVSLSEQNLVDCSGSYGTQGCNGGWMDYAFSYVRDNKGIDTEAGYPYYGRELGYCYFNKQYVGATDVSYTDITSGDEEALKAAVATVGPVSVAIDATHSSFSGYTSGVYVEPQCGNAISSLDHAVLVVGYGTENGQDFWLVKNSWGASWGDGGYIKMARNLNNQCGIATKASYPNV